MTFAIDAAAVHDLRQRRILFGHQSVGANIIAGLNDLLAGDPQRGPRIIETSDPDGFREPALVHFRIGRNHDPESKLAAFAEILKSEVGQQAELALFKFCYVDVTAGTDIEQLFNAYRDTMMTLSATSPGTRLAHITIPVTVIPGLLRRAVGNILGRYNQAAHDNLARAEFNRRLRATFGARDPIFDLAAIEATAPSGRVNRFTLQGRQFEALYPPYSSDGRHLSGTGRRAVAAAFLNFLSQAFERAHPDDVAVGRGTPTASRPARD